MRTLSLKVFISMYSPLFPKKRDIKRDLRKIINTKKTIICLKKQILEAGPVPNGTISRSKHEYNRTKRRKST